ncbi:hypothetical protein Sxan_67710 [Streptomyces xanthophaeus]|uniref:Uncharacterized protein n=1 Tax=Streptomyces xanthophaeus TaxID=67385 RepID=A0A919H5B8_9ACTN|nr:hypothetical protein Sxan_67710 [Streptomyces xanthophaeus]
MELEQTAYDAHVTDVGNVAQAAGSTAEQRGDHGLGHEVLRTADSDLALKRGAAVDKQYIVTDAGHESRVPGGVGRGPEKRVRVTTPLFVWLTRP